MAAKRGGKGKGKEGGITIIRREEVIAGGHHGGAWKVAYADFVTAMMAFFLLMWLLNATTEAQRRGLADYFSPTLSTSSGKSGSGKPLGGTSPFVDGPAISDRGTIAVMTANSPPVESEDDGSDTPAMPVVHTQNGDGEAALVPAPGKSTRSGAQQSGVQTLVLAHSGAGGPGDAKQIEARRLEEAAFSRAAAAIAKGIAIDPALAPLAKQLAIDLTPEGLRIQIRDAEKNPMFTVGSSDPSPQAVALLQRMAPILMNMNEDIAIAGHTDGAAFTGVGRSNWDLSTERALSARRILAAAGFPENRVRDVAGHADRDLLLPDQPLAAANRRIAIIVLRAVPPP